MRNLVAGLCKNQDITILSYDPPSDVSYNIEQITLPQLKSSYWRIAPLQHAWHYRNVIRAMALPQFDVLLAMDCHLGFAVASIRAQHRVYISLSCVPRQEWFGSNQRSLLIFAQYAFLERLLIRRSDLTIVASDSQRGEIQRFELLPKFNPMILPPAFPALEGENIKGAYEEKSQNSDVVTFLTVCRLVPVKRVDRILAIADRLRGLNCRFTIVGDGPQLETLRRHAELLNVDQFVNFVGGTSQPETFFRQADFLLHPSNYESFGMVVFEAMRHGVIPLCSKSDGLNIGIAAFMNNGVNGMLVNFNDVDATVSTIQQLLGNSDQRKRLRQGARQLAKDLMGQNYVQKLSIALNLKVA